MTVKLTIAAAILGLTTAFALAETTAPAAPEAAASPDAARGKRWAACATEVQKFCANSEKGKGVIRNCLESHKAELSDTCKARLAERAAKEKSQN